MRLALLALLLTFAGCEKKEGVSKASASETPKAAETERPSAPVRSAKLPDLRPQTAPRTGQIESALPPDFNPPGAPRVDGVLQVDRDVKFVDLEVGHGPPPVKGKPVEVHYSGYLTNGTKFDASVDRGEPIKFNFDGGMVIKGWDIGLSSMKVGGKRRIMIPAELAYGDNGAGDAIPPGSILVFDVELISAEQ